MNQLLIQELYYYLFPPTYKLLDWIPLENLDINFLVCNSHPGVVDVLLENNITIKNIGNLLHNPNPRVNQLKLTQTNIHNIATLNRLTGGLTPSGGSIQGRTRSTELVGGADSSPKGARGRGFASDINNHCNMKYIDDNLLKRCQTPTPEDILYIKNYITKLNSRCWIALFRNCEKSYILQFLKKNIGYIGDQIWENICINPLVCVINEILIQNIDRFSQECWLNLCKNPSDNMVDILSKNKDNLNMDCWYNLCFKPKCDGIINFLCQNQEKFDDRCWENLCYKLTSHMILDLITQNTDRLTIECWDSLCENSCKNRETPYPIELCDRVLHFVSLNIEKLDSNCWDSLCQNSNQNVINILTQNLDRLPLKCWEQICNNTNISFCNLLLQNIDKLDDRCWARLCKNTRTDILENIISKYINRLTSRLCWYNCWVSLCKNKNGVAIHIIRDLVPILQNYKNFWDCLSGNPNIFEIDPILTKKHFHLWKKNIL